MDLRELHRKVGVLRLVKRVIHYIHGTLMYIPHQVDIIHDGDDLVIVLRLPGLGRGETSDVMNDADEGNTDNSSEEGEETWK